MKQIVKKAVLILVAVFLLTWILLYVSGGNINGAMIFVDWPSLIIVVFPVFFILVFADLWSDYVRAYKFALGNKDFTTKELKASVEAIDLSVKITVITGGIGTLVGLMSSLVNITDLSYIGVYLAVVIITALYALIFNLIQMPIRARIKKELIYREN